MTPSKGRLVVVGIDPGTTATGYGVLSRSAEGAVALMECGVFRTTSSAPLHKRIREIFEGVYQVLERFEPDVVSVEAVFQGKNARSALVLGHARGAVLVAASLRDVKIAEYAPREIKKAVVGTGSATKAQVGFMVQERLRLKDPPSPSDAADGVAAALCYLTLAVDGRMAGLLPHRFARRGSS